MIILIFYVTLFVLAFLAVRIYRRRNSVTDYTSLRTVTFGDESAVVPDRAASIISIVAIFLIWGAFTGSKLVPIHMPGPFVGETGFTYIATNAKGETDEAKVTVLVHPLDEAAELPEGGGGDGFARDDTAGVGAWRSVLLKVGENDQGGEDSTYQITLINDQPVVAFARRRGQAVYRNCQEWLSEYLTLGTSGFVADARAGRLCAGVRCGHTPLGYAMGLSGWFRG